ncbi:hypothetical protein ACFWVM_00790 [Nocardia fluminea]|uniref:hypothetical protein n=1 Tax=Nocardia fluminea TaxID=134984 RepID=UPI00366813A1
MPEMSPFIVIHDGSGTDGRNPRTFGESFDVVYLPMVGVVAVTVGEGSVFLDPSHTAVLIDKLTAALDSYAATLTAVA